jgi:F-type H+-transporting ATPase subunit delta
MSWRARWSSARRARRKRMFISHFNDAVFLAKLIDFIIFITAIVWVYNRYVQPALVRYQESQNRIVADAVAYRDRSDGAVAAANTAIDQAKLDAGRMVNVGDAQAARLIEAEIAAAKEHAQRIGMHASGELERERYRVRRELLEETVESAHTKAQELAKQEIDTHKQWSLVERLIQDQESIAQRYSEALFGLAKDGNLVEPVTNELDRFVDMLARNSDLADFYNSPVVDRDEKIKLLVSVLDGRLHELTLNFIVLLVRKRRENIVTIVARQMHQLLDRQAGRAVAAIATPLPLEHSQLQELAQRLGAVYDATVIPETKISPELLGGLVVQVGDRYVDASVSGKLEELRRHLLESADTWATTSPNGQP